jgi:hypothetical protein
MAVKGWEAYQNVQQAALTIAELKERVTTLENRVGELEALVERLGEDGIKDLL